MRIRDIEEADLLASIALHAAPGFEVVGRLPQIGAKFDRGATCYSGNGVW